MTTTILVRDWRKMTTQSEATLEHAKRKVDSDGKVWEWVCGGKRIKARLIPSD